MEMTETMAPRPLAELEAVIERGLTTFVEVGRALLEIREQRLYRETHESFETYCRERWGWSSRHVNRQIEAAGVAAALGPMGPIPESERQARELARLPEPEAVREVWSEVKEAHGDDVTAADVREAVDRRLGVEPRPHPSLSEPIEDIDGEQYETLPFDLAARQIVDEAPDEILTATPAQQAALRAMADAEHLLKEPDEERAFYMIGKQRVWIRLTPALVAETSRQPDQDAPEWEAFAGWCSQVAEALRRRSSQPFRVIG